MAIHIPRGSEYVGELSEQQSSFRLQLEMKIRESFLVRDLEGWDNSVTWQNVPRNKTQSPYKANCE